MGDFSLPVESILENHLDVSSKWGSKILNFRRLNIEYPDGAFKNSWNIRPSNWGNASQLDEHILQMG